MGDIRAFHIPLHCSSVLTVEAPRLTHPRRFRIGRTAKERQRIITGWWFQTFFIFHNIWDNPSHWLSYFSEGYTTNQIRIVSRLVPRPWNRWKLEPSTRSYSNESGDPKWPQHPSRRYAKVTHDTCTSFGFYLKSGNIDQTSPEGRWKHLETMLNVSKSLFLSQQGMTCGFWWIWAENSEILWPSLAEATSVP